MKNYIVGVLLCLAVHLEAQEQEKEKGLFFGGLESIGTWYLNDKGLEVRHPEDPVRSNTYLLLNYKYRGFSAGLQAESYEEQHLLNYNPRYENTNVATWFAQYQNEKVQLTAGYFYEQFGSGLLYRSWEDRALGINNALRGGRIVYSPTDYIIWKSIYGRQRSGFVVSRGEIFGSDVEVGLSKLFQLQTTDLSLGLTYLGRYEHYNLPNQNFNDLTNAFGIRSSFAHNAWYGGAEFDYKSKDAIVQVQEQLDNNFIKPGSALLLNIGYSTKGFGVDASFRRLENMAFFSERNAAGNQFNDRIVNFIPSLTKQHHYNLANIYVFQAQPRVYLEDETLVKAGEIGGQLDVFYEFKKGTSFGGKFGTKVSVNLAHWNALGGTFSINNPKDYDVDFIGFGRKYFHDYNIEVVKKFTNKWYTIFAYINQYYDKRLVEGQAGLVKTNILSAEGTYKFSSTRSLRVLGEHMWASADKKNWASATLEYNMNLKWSLFTTDLYNYGNDEAKKRNHYFIFGSAYRHKSTRLSVSYGRQRGGLICVGGVCRFVEENSGVTVSLNTTF